MTTIRFINSHGIISGFELSGHSGYADEGTDIVCSAVSSAAYMTANTITEILSLDADIDVRDGYLSMKLSSQNAMKAQDIIRGFELHMNELSQQYNDNISVIYSEV